MHWVRAFGSAPLFLVMALVGCGGGGDTEPPVEAPKPPPLAPALKPQDLQSPPLPIFTSGDRRARGTRSTYCWRSGCADYAEGRPENTPLAVENRMLWVDTRVPAKRLRVSTDIDVSREREDGRLWLLRFSKSVPSSLDIQIWYRARNGEGNFLVALRG